MGERRALAKLSTIMDNTSHPLHQTVGALSSSFSNRLRHPRCRKERFRSRGWFRSIDLWVMGPARFRCATLLLVVVANVAGGLFPPRHYMALCRLS
ncbi:hypothetical protein L3Q82_020851 [Scortum barcoo]|uniref:Uncharacterized protein n=1 Tax=Scortum barcoo TaxID=214431 RepID=A0ACB8V945_9TELE|nr:hypothetical protein L3Q82_020851 [Scortum barcoo]